MMDNEPVNTKEEISEQEEPVYKDRSLLYMGVILGIIILVMGYLTLFVDDPSKLFTSKKEQLVNNTEDKSKLLTKTESMSDETVRTSLTKFIEAFYFDQRRGYFDPPSYFADITETFYNYHNLTQQRLKDLYWQRLADMKNLQRNWIVSTLDFEREDSRITATYWAKESYFKPSLNEDRSALIKYELIINEAGKIVSLREVDVKNQQVNKRVADSTQTQVSDITATVQAPAANDKIYDFSLVETQPEFAGGQKEFMKYVGSNIKYPPTARQNNIQGKVYISFIVEKDGQLTDVKVKQGIGGGCDEEAVRVLRNSPKWKPGLIGGAPVRTYFVLPITFQL